LYRLYGRAFDHRSRCKIEFGSVTRALDDRAFEVAIYQRTMSVGASLVKGVSVLGLADKNDVLSIQFKRIKLTLGKR